MPGIISRVRFSIYVNTFVKRLMLLNVDQQIYWECWLVDWIAHSAQDKKKMVLASHLGFLPLINLPSFMSSGYWNLNSMLLNRATPHVICCYAHYWAIAFFWTSLRKSNISSPSQPFQFFFFFFKWNSSFPQSCGVICLKILLNS